MTDEELKAIEERAAGAGEHLPHAFIRPAEVLGLIAALRREREARGAAEGWQPIETAPKDGTLVMLYLPGEPEWSRFTVAAWDGESNNWSGVSPSATGLIWRNRPTHWMPLPAPPDD